MVIKMLKRKIYEDLLKWQRSDNKKAILLKGSKHVGKSYIVNYFAKENYQNFAAPFPDKVEFCGQEVPIDNILVREALDMELNLIMYNHSMTFLILKKAERYFPEIEAILKNQNIPEDIKYLAVAESGLANLVSPAKAEGVWQFVLPTAKEYGLEDFEGWDERYDLEKSTIAACKYLRNKKSVFNDWALACASYNSGETGVKNRMREQGSDNYWELYTNTETSRYVYRIINSSACNK